MKLIKYTPNETDNLNTVVSNLQTTLNQYREDIMQLAKLNFKVFQPEVENSENLITQINSLHEEINQLKDDLEENVINPFVYYRHPILLF